jgi:phosphomannomutase
MCRKILLLFDVDGTIANSGKKIDIDVKRILQKLDPNKFELGIVGGGEKNKILYQIDNLPFSHIFSECGCVYHKRQSLGNYEFIYSKNIQNYTVTEEGINIFSEKVQHLISICLDFIANKIKVPVSGHFVDRRKGLYYISLVGMQANDKERQEFIIMDNLNKYREDLLYILNNSIPIELKPFLDVKIGGSTGITILPKEWNKSQVMSTVNTDNYEHVYFFGDKYEKDGNDYELLTYNATNFTGVPVNTITDTIEFLKKIFM